MCVMLWAVSTSSAVGSADRCVGASTVLRRRQKGRLDGMGWGRPVCRGGVVYMVWWAVSASAVGSIRRYLWCVGARQHSAQESAEGCSRLDGGGLYAGGGVKSGVLGCERVMWPPECNREQRWRAQIDEKGLH